MTHQDLDDGTSLWSETEVFIIQHWNAGIGKKGMWLKPNGFASDYSEKEALGYAKKLIDTYRKVRVVKIRVTETVVYQIEDT